MFKWNDYALVSMFKLAKTGAEGDLENNPNSKLQDML